MMKKILIFAFVSMISACGGGGGGSATVASTTRAIVTNTLRTFLSGDNIQYSVTGTIATTGSINNPGTTTTTFNGTGQYSTAINSSPLDPTGVKRSISTLSFSGALTNGTPFNSTSNNYFAQTASGTMNSYGDPVAGWITVPATGFVPTIISPITSPASWSINYTQQNGDVTVGTVTLIGKTTVTTGMGAFEAFQYNYSYTTTLAGFILSPGSNVVTQKFYIVPSIGPIKIIINTASYTSFGLASTSNFTLTASTTNIGF